MMRGSTKIADTSLESVPPGDVFCRFDAPQWLTFQHTNKYVFYLSQIHCAHNARWNRLLIKNFLIYCGWAMGKVK